jgi:molecular chaperone DnaK
METRMGKIIGIDLGTTNSVVAIVEGSEPTVITNPQGNRTTPSIVSFQENNERLVGQLAKRQAVQNPTNTIFSIKRFIGRRYNEVAKEEKMVPYTITGNGNGPIKIKILDKQYTPPEISAFILRNLKETAEAYLGNTVTEAVITVPAYFNDAQRQATKDAGKIAGLEVRRIINEPTAAALAFGLQQKKTDTKIAIFDFGGGTFDISILEITDIDGEQVFEVKATNGDTRLGGDDLDEALINYVADEFKKENNIDLRKDKMALQRLKEACEKAKCELSTTPATPINLPFIAQDSKQNAIHLNMNLTRAKFEDLCEVFLDRLIAPCKTCLNDAGLDITDIDEVLLVGGSTRIPRVAALVKELFGKEATKSINPDEVVALGAAVQASILENPSGTAITFLDVTPLSLGVEVEGGIFIKLIEKNTTIPTQKKEIFSTAEDMQPAVDIHVYQGERPLAKDNRLLDSFKLDGLPPAQRGVPRIEVSFDIDVNGILDVSATDLGTDKKQHITITTSSGLSESQIKKMCKEAEENAEQDKLRKKNIETKNKAEQLVYSIKKGLKSWGDKLTDEDKSELETEIETLEEAIKKDNTSTILTSKNKLEEIQKNIAEKIYSTATTTAQTEDEEDVIDAETEE